MKWHSTKILDELESLQVIDTNQSSWMKTFFRYRKLIYLWASGIGRNNKLQKPQIHITHTIFCWFSPRTIIIQVTCKAQKSLDQHFIFAGIGIYFLLKEYISFLHWEETQQSGFSLTFSLLLYFVTNIQQHTCQYNALEIGAPELKKKPNQQSL